jgi:D-beta-D-heptose 7-phosphate kinase/D-beta-D-heptose 1-phosphate adenosyltransferase
MKIIVNGTFDLLHRKHIEMLEYANSLGSSLLVLIDSDSRVKSLKGPSRPIINQIDRQYILKSLKYVNDVWVFDTDEDLVNSIKTFSPDIMVKGEDWKGKEILGAEYCKEIRYFKRDNDFSTTNTIQHIINRR